MKKFAVTILPLALIVGAFLLVGGAKKEAKCPISGGPAKDGISLNVNGDEVGFCCKKCPEAYKKKIGLVKSEADKCPLSGNAAKAETGIIHRSAKMVYFCCNNCPKGYAKKNGFKVVDKGPKKCPMSGNPAKDADGTSLIVNGEKLYFCCKNCPKAYKEKKLAVKDEGAKECAVSGRPAKAATGQIHVTSKSVFFCCKNCQKKYIAQNFKGEKKGKDKKK